MAAQSIREAVGQYLNEEYGIPGGEAREHVEIMVDTGVLKPGMKVAEAYIVAGEYIKKHADLPDAHLYAQDQREEDRFTDSVPPANHAESPVTVFPDGRGDVTYNGVRYNVSFRYGATAEHALAQLQEWDRFWKLGAKQGITCNQFRPSDNGNGEPPQRGNVTNFQKPARPQNELEDAVDNGVFRSKVTAVEYVQSSKGTDGYKLYRNDNEGKRVSIGTTWSPKTIEKLSAFAILSGMAVGDVRTIPEPFMALYKKSEKQNQYGNNYNDIIGFEAA